MAIDYECELKELEQLFIGGKKLIEAINDEKTILNQRIEDKNLLAKDIQLKLQNLIDR